MKKSSSALMSFLLLQLCLLFLLSPPLISAAAQKLKCHPKDQKAIQQIQASFGINFTGDCCDWAPLVSCTVFPPYNRVTSFQFVGGSNFSGQIPAAIGDLSYLKYLAFGNVPHLTGNIPPAITKLSKLSQLSIVSTGISGPIPTFPVNLTNFSLLQLSDNAFTGSIPSDLPSWFPNLNSLELQNNKLTGTIPESLGNLSIDFSTLNLSHNSLTGPIPKSLGNLDVDEIDFSGNKFTGDASFLFGENKTTEYLNIAGNNFTFDLSKVQITPRMRVLNLSHNNIFGSIPQDLTQAQFLLELDVSHNKLCGKIPQGVQKFGISRYSHNKCLCGVPLPPCVK